MKNRMILRFAVLLTLVLAMAGPCNPVLAGAASGDEKPVTVRLGHNSHAESFTGKALVEWAKQLSDKTGGKLKIEIFPQNQMGSNKELSEQTALGSLDINVQGMSALVDYKVEEGYMAKVPFLFRSTEHAYRWWTSPEGTAIIKKAEAQRVKVLEIGLNRMPRQFAPRPSRSRIPMTSKG